MSKSNWSVKDSFTIDRDNVEYIVTFYAQGTYYYDPGCMYLRNGDPGYPPEEETDVTYLEIESVTDDDGNDIVGKLTAEDIEKLEAEAQELICDGKCELDFGEPELEEE